MKKRYAITLDTPMGPRNGILTFRINGGAVDGTLRLLGFENPFHGSCSGGVLTFRHRLRTQVSELSCAATLHATDGGVEGETVAGNTSMPVTGSALPDEILEEGGNHGKGSQR